MKQIFRLVHDQARQRAQEAIKTAPEGHIVTISEPTRTLEQNAALHPKIREIQRQVNWHGIKLSEEDWRLIFTATLYGQRSVPNLDGTGFIILGKPTKTMPKGDFSQLLDLVNAFAASKGVVSDQG